jgi:DNA topoisomerase-1
MKGLSAKVFRTYNASITFQEQLEKLTNENDSIPDKLLSYNRANREVAVLCNHQKAASKNHEQQISKMGDRIRAIKYQRMKLRKTLYDLDPKAKKNGPYADSESDLEEEWMIQHEKDLVAKEKDKVKIRFEKQNEKLAAENQPLLPESELIKNLKTTDLLLEKLANERKAATIEAKASMTAEKTILKIEKMDERIAAIKTQTTDREENKQIALGTSKLNYIDPRISVTWCKKYNVPLEKVFSKTLLEKFRWAQKIPENWVNLKEQSIEFIILTSFIRNSNHVTYYLLNTLFFLIKTKAEKIFIVSNLVVIVSPSLNGCIHGPNSYLSCDVALKNKK